MDIKEEITKFIDYWRSAHNCTNVIPNDGNKTRKISVVAINWKKIPDDMMLILEDIFYELISNTSTSYDDGYLSTGIIKLDLDENHKIELSRLKHKHNDIVSTGETILSCYYLDLVDDKNILTIVTTNEELRKILNGFSRRDEILAGFLLSNFILAENLNELTGDNL